MCAESNDKMITFAVCDDEKRHISNLCDMLVNIIEPLDYDYEVIRFETANELINYTGNYDILFLDIMLDHGADGITIGKKLRSHGNDSVIILVTSHDNRCFDGYHTNAFRYLVKPLEFEKLREAVISAISEIIESEKRLEIRYKHTSYFVPIQSIEMVERFYGHRKVHAMGKEFITNDSWVEILSNLPKHQFIQVERSFTVNLKHVMSVKNFYALMLSGKEIKISRSYKKAFDSAFNSFIGGKSNGDYSNRL